MNALVAPRAHAGCHQKIDPVGVAFGALFQKLERPVNAAGLVAVNTARNQHERLVLPPVPIADRKQPIAIGGVVQVAVFRYGEPRGQAVNSRHHIVRVATLAKPVERATGRVPLRPMEGRACRWGRAWACWSWRLQNTMLSAATGATVALALRPAAVNTAPTIRPTRLLKLYSTAGASVNTSLEPKSC